MPQSRSHRIAFALIAIVVLAFSGRNLYRRYLNSALLAAIRSRDVAFVRSLLDRGADPNTRYFLPVEANRPPQSEPVLEWVLSSLVLPDSIVQNPSGESRFGNMRPSYLPDPRGEEIACLLIRKGAQQPVGRNYLASACSIGDIPVARCLLDSGADLKSPDVSAAALGAALHYAISLNTSIVNGGREFSMARTAADKAEVARRVAVSRDLVQLLLARGARPTLRQAQDLGDRAAEMAILTGNPATWAAEGYSALSVAASRNDMELMRQLLAHGADPNHPARSHPVGSDMPLDGRNYDLPLHAAADKGNMEAVKLLLAHGADPNAHLQYGEPALTAATRKGNVPLVTLLLAHGADPNSATQFAPPALCVAANTGNLALVKLLLAHGAQLNSGELFLPLQSAVQSGHTEVVHYLLERGADPNVKQRWHASVLAYALRHPSPAIDDLLQHGANVNPVPDEKMPGDLPYSPLTNALWYAPHYEALLVRAGAELGADKPVICAFAALSGRYDLLPKLMAYGADVNGMNRYGATALSICIDHAHGSVKFLLDHGANPNMVMRDKRTPLEEAAMLGNVEVVRQLLAHGADFNAHPDHHTALAWAQKKKHADVAALLQQAGAKE